MKLVEYDRKYKDDFIKFNKEWIIEYFDFLEEEDIHTFEHLEDLLKKGSMIYMATENDTLLAGCMVRPMEELKGSVWEMCKLCSNKNVSHKGAGSAVFGACMDYAIKNGAKKLFILSNRKLKPALHIYDKFGFREVEIHDNNYQRGNVAFEYDVEV